MIKALRMKNWKVHRDTSLDFQKGVNVLVGIMGAGKSSSVDAISFALFGTFPNLNSKKVKMAGLISNRPAPAQEAEVGLDFTVGGDDYTVTRKITPNGAGIALLEKNGQRLQSQPSKVTEEIEGILKVDYDTFARVVYSEQNGLDYFLGLPKAERKKQIDHMLGLDAFARAEENATSLINSRSDMAKRDAEELARADIKGMRARLKEAVEELERLAKEQESMTAEEAESRKAAVEMGRRLEAAKGQMAAKKRMEGDIATMEGRLGAVREELRKLQDVKADESEAKGMKAEEEARVRKLEAELKELRDRANGHMKEKAAALANRKHAEEQIAERDSFLEQERALKGESLEKEIDETGKKTAEAMEMLAAAKARMADAEKWRKELEEHIGKCPVCERDLDEAMKERLKAEKARQVGDARAEAERRDAEVRGLQRQSKDLSEKQKKFALVKSRLASLADADQKAKGFAEETERLGAAIGEIEHRQAEMEKGLEKARERLAEANGKVQLAERKKAYEKEEKEMGTRLSALMEEAAKLDVDEKKVYALQEEAGKAAARADVLKAKTVEAARYIAAQGKAAGEQERQITELERKEKAVERERVKVKNLNLFKAALIDTEKMLRNRLVSSINGLMQGVWPKLYPYGDYGNIRLTAKADDYLLEVKTHGTGDDEWVQVDGVASGGERSIACLSMRIALAMVVVPNLRWLILDEPTHNIDSNGIGSLIEILGSTLPEVVDQVFIVTHDDSLKQIPSAKVYQFDRDKARDAPARVAEQYG